MVPRARDEHALLVKNGPNVPQRKTDFGKQQAHVLQLHRHAEQVFGFLFAQNRRNDRNHASLADRTWKDAGDDGLLFIFNACVCGQNEAGQGLSPRDARIDDLLAVGVAQQNVAAHDIAHFNCAPMKIAQVGLIQIAGARKHAQRLDQSAHAQIDCGSQVAGLNGGLLLNAQALGASVAHQHIAGEHKAGDHQRQNEGQQIGARAEGGALVRHRLLQAKSFQAGLPFAPHVLHRRNVLHR